VIAIVIVIYDLFIVVVVMF